MTITSSTRRKRASAALVASITLGSLATSAPAALAAGAWQPTADVVADGNGGYTLVVSGNLPTNCTNNKSYVEVTVDGAGTKSSGVVRAASSAFSVTYEGLSSPGPFQVTSIVKDAPKSCTQPSAVTTAVDPTWSDDSIEGTGVLGQPYSDSIAAAGSPAPTFSIVAGALPAGIVLDPTAGTLTGTPTEFGQFDFTVRAANSGGHVDIVRSIDVQAAPAWTDQELADEAEVGVAYDDAVAAEGNPAPSYSISAGELPDGLDLDTATGAVTGTPTEDGEFTFSIEAENALGDIAEEHTITVSSDPVWSDQTLGAGRAGQAYSDGVAATGVPSPTYAVQDGSTLPEGLTLDETTGAIAGTPTTAGEYSFVVVAANSAGSTPTTVTISIATAYAAPQWSDSDLLGKVTIGRAYSDSVAATGNPAPTYSVVGSLPAGLSLDPATGAITGTATALGTSSFTVKASNGQGSDASVQRSIVVVPVYDANGPQGAIYRLYRAYFLREPDKGGYEYWLNLHTKSGVSLVTISGEFAKSKEFVNRYGTLTNADFLTLVYNNVMDREPDQEGYDYWMAQMAKGMTRGHVMLLFSESQEFKNKTAGSVPPGY